MKNKRRSTPEVVFPLRVDQNGYRPVYKLGNEGGNCSFGCKFCGVGKSVKITSAENIATFDALHTKYLTEIDGPYHPAIFNRGNVTDSKSFSLATLDHILGVFEPDKRITYLSLNSRDSTATTEVLCRLVDRNLPFPIHFIYGQESFNESAQRILGKNNQGEMEQFMQKLKCHNQAYQPHNSSKRYLFGLDVNLVFLPELYLQAGESRRDSETRIAEGLVDDLRKLLVRTDPLVPVEVNIHPYYEVEALPYEKADLLQLLRILPTLQRIIDEHNRKPGMYRTHLFLGVVFFVEGANEVGGSRQAQKLSQLQQAINDFNRAGGFPATRGDVPTLA
jgi:hypothetical protein